MSGRSLDTMYSTSFCFSFLILFEQPKPISKYKIYNVSFISSRCLRFLVPCIICWWEATCFTKFTSFLVFCFWLCDLRSSVGCLFVFDLTRKHTDGQ